MHCRMGVQDRPFFLDGGWLGETYVQVCPHVRRGAVWSVALDRFLLSVSKWVGGGGGRR